jgi:hypothetical protein
MHRAHGPPGHGALIRAAPYDGNPASAGSRQRAIPLIVSVSAALAFRPFRATVRKLPETR